MLEKVKSAVIPHIIGFIVIIVGWYISILNVGLNRFQQNVLITKWTALGLALILVGAYIPDIWGSITRR